MSGTFSNILSDKRKVIALVIGIQIMVAITCTGFNVYRVYIEPESGLRVGLFFFIAMSLLSGPINLTAVSNFLLFSTISVVVGIVLIFFAISRPSYVLMSCFLLAWWISGVSGLMFVS